MKGPRVDNTVTCSNCKALINVNAEKRSVSHLPHQNAVCPGLIYLQVLGFIQDCGISGTLQLKRFVCHCPLVKDLTGVMFQVRLS